MFVSGCFMAMTSILLFQQFSVEYSTDKDACLSDVLNVRHKICTQLIVIMQISCNIGGLCYSCVHQCSMIQE